MGEDPFTFTLEQVVMPIDNMFSWTQSQLLERLTALRELLSQGQWGSMAPKSREGERRTGREFETHEDLGLLQLVVAGVMALPDSATNGGTLLADAYRRHPIDEVQVVYLSEDNHDRATDFLLKAFALVLPEIARLN
jgi:hypothetical protein